MSQLTFTHLFSDIYAVKSGLAEFGIRLTHNQVYLFLLLKEFMGAERRVTVTRRDLYEGAICQHLGFSRSTFNRAFNELVKKRCLLPMGIRDKSGWLGHSEEYRLTMVSKTIDAILKSSIAVAA